jgi:hypothetical protein
MRSKRERLVLWFSCGAASAVAAKLAIAKYRGQMEIVIGYTDTGSEHPDNKRFLSDCEKWFDHPITIMKSDRYKDTWDVFKKARYLVGVDGARCTTELKKSVRQRFENLKTDLQVFGFTVEERARAERFAENNFEVDLCCPLIDEMLTKADCLAMLREAGIEIPMMYKMGYRNNNCIGCVKGGMGYWNKIRRDFPAEFDRMALVERELDAAICKRYEIIDGEEVRVRVFLDELKEGAGNYKAEPDIECGILCYMAKQQYEDESCEV